MKSKIILLDYTKRQLADKCNEVTEEHEIQNCDMDEIHQGVIELNDVMEFQGILSDDYKSF